MVQGYSYIATSGVKYICRRWPFLPQKTTAKVAVLRRGDRLRAEIRGAGMVAMRGADGAALRTLTSRNNLLKWQALPFLITDHLKQSRNTSELIWNTQQLLKQVLCLNFSRKDCSYPIQLANLSETSAYKKNKYIIRAPSPVGNKFFHTGSTKHVFDFQEYNCLQTSAALEAS